MKKILEVIQEASGSIESLPLYVPILVFIVGIGLAVVAGKTMGVQTGEWKKGVSILLTLALGGIILLSLAMLWWYLRIGPLPELSDLRDLTPVESAVVNELMSLAKGFIPSYLFIARYVYQRTHEAGSVVQTRNAAYRAFLTSLDQLRDNYLSDLSQKNVLKRQIQNEIAGKYTLQLARIVNELHEALATSDERTPRLRVSFDEAKSRSMPITELAAGGASSAGAGALSALLPVATTGFWFWTKSITLGAFIGAGLGVTPAVATAGLSILIGLVVGVAVAISLGRRRRQAMRVNMINKFDDIVHDLESWAAKEVKRVNKKK